MSQQPTAPLTVEQIIDAFSKAQRGRIPVRALRDAQLHRYKLIAPFQASIDQHLALSAAGRLQAEGDWRLPSFAWNLLALWKVPGTYERIMSGLLLPDRYDSLWLMARPDQHWPSLLLSTFDGDAARLQQLIANPKVHEDCRICFMQVLVGAVHHRLVDEESIVPWLGQMLGALGRVKSTKWLHFKLAISAARLRLGPLKPLISNILHRYDTQHDLNSLKLLELYYRFPWLRLNSMRHGHFNPIGDLESEIRTWMYFHPLPSREHEENMKLLLGEKENRRRLRARKKFEASIAKGSRPGPFVLPERHTPCFCRSGKPFGACCGQK